MFARPWPLGRLARAVLIIIKNIHTTTIQDLNTPWAKGLAIFFLRRGAS